MQRLEELRNKIDKTDDAVLDLLLQREELVQEIGEAKQDKEGAAIYYRPEREASILRRLIAHKNEKGSKFPDAFIYGVYRQIISACLSLEDSLSVAYLGPEGTYTYEAAVKHFPQAKFIDCQTIEQVFEAVSATRCQLGVIPIENSYEGAVHRSIDAFLKFSHVNVIAELVLPVRHSLLAHEGDDFDSIHTLYSHEQTLAQCKQYLSGVKADLIPVLSNAQAAVRAQNAGKGHAAIASENAAALYGLQILERHIEDADNNQTRFFIIGATKTAPSGNDKTVLILTAHNKPGALLDILQPFSQHNISLSRVVSRPAPSGLWEYVFYIEVAGHCEQEPLATVIKQLDATGNIVRIIGSYPVS